MWTVLENYMSFVEDQTEWVDTQIRFDLTERDGGTEVTFTHVGLLADHECYEVCSKAWTYYLTESLPNLVTTGAGRPEGEPEDALRGPEPSRIRGRSTPRSCRHPRTAAELDDAGAEDARTRRGPARRGSRPAARPARRHRAAPG